MDIFIQWVLYITAVASGLCWIVFSVLSRRTTDKRTRGLRTARVNISMGLLLVTIATIQIVSFDNSAVRITVGSIFLILGLFNLFAGIRNHSAYSRM